MIGQGRLGRYVAIGLLAVLAVACGNRKEKSEPPAELVKFDQTLDVRKLWSVKVGRGTERLRLGLRPASDGLRVYAGAHNGDVIAVDIETGRKLWSAETDLALAGGPGLGNGMLAFGSSDGVLIALDAETGMELWRSRTVSEIMAAPAIGPNMVVFRTLDGGLRAHAAADGQPVWNVEQDLESLVLRGDTAPRIVGSIVVAGFDNGRVGTYELATGVPLWEVAVGVPSGRGELARLIDMGAAGLEVSNNIVYAVGFHGALASIPIASGNPSWSLEVSSYAGLGLDFANVYVTTDVDAVVAYERSLGTEQWRQEALRLRDVTAPTRFADAVVVGDFEGYLHWLDVATGEFVARVRASRGRVTSPPLAVGNRLIVQTDDGSLVAFAIREQEPEEEEAEPEPSQEAPPAADTAG